MASQTCDGSCFELSLRGPLLRVNDQLSKSGDGRMLGFDQGIHSLLLMVLFKPRAFYRGR